MKIDAHHHIWDLTVRPQDWFTPVMQPTLGRDYAVEDWEEVAAQSGIDRSIIVQTVPVPAETPEMLAIASQHARVSGVVGWVDFDPATIEADLESLRNMPGADKWVGVRENGQRGDDHQWLADDSVTRCIRATGKAGLTVDFLARTHHLPAAVEAARSNPDTLIVLDHLAKPDIAGGGHDHWAALIKQLKPYDNVACKVSGLVTEASDNWRPDDLRPYVDTVLDIFGPERLMFGSDWPVCLLAAEYAQVVDAAAAITGQLSAAEATSFWSGTASRWYRLPQHDHQEEQ